MDEIGTLEGIAGTETIIVLRMVKDEPGIRLWRLGIEDSYYRAAVGTDI